MKLFIIRNTTLFWYEIISLQYSHVSILSEQEKYHEVGGEQKDQGRVLRPPLIIKAEAFLCVPVPQHQDQLRDNLSTSAS